MSDTLLTASTETTAATTTAATTETPAATTATTTTAATTEKPAETTASVTTEKPAETAKVEGAPDAYADFTVPKDVELPGDVATEVKAVAKALNLPQEKAQQVFDAAAKAVSKTYETQQTAINTVQAGWKAEVLADKEVGGDKLAENMAIAKSVMLASTTPQLQMLLKRTGLEGNVEVIRHFLKIAPAFVEGKFVPGGRAPAGDKSAASILYPAKTA